MPEDLKLSQISSSQLLPPFRGLHSPGVRKHCQIMSACYFLKSCIRLAHSQDQVNDLISLAHSQDEVNKIIILISLHCTTNYKGWREVREKVCVGGGGGYAAHGQPSSNQPPVCRNLCLELSSTVPVPSSLRLVND